LGKERERKELKSLMDFLSFLGLLTLLAILYFIGLFIYENFFLSIDLKVYGAKSGAWAIVTGSSDGIGKGFAEELAREGFNIILVSRTESKLKEISANLQKQFSVQTAIVAIDVSSKDTDSVLNKIKSTMDLHGPISLLVNNVGVNTDKSIPTPFLEMSDKDIDDMININVVFTTKMTRLCIPYLLKNKKSAIINLSSITAVMSSVPYLSVYAGTKAYDGVLSKALTPELKRSGCDVIAISPYLVVSNMSNARRPALFVRQPNEIARATFPHIGRRSEYTPFWSHNLLRAVSGLIPDSIKMPMVLSRMEATRKRLREKSK